MKIFYFLTKSEVGGAQTVVYELLRFHKKESHNVMVMAEGDGWLAEKVRELGFEYVENRWMRKTYNPLSLLRAGLYYRKIVSRFKPNVISIHNSFSGIIGRLFSRRGIPVVYTAHGWGFVYGSFLMKYPGLILEKIAGYFCDAVICVSYSDARIAKLYRIVPQQKIHVIHNGINIEDTSISKSNSPTVVFLGRFAHPKQQVTLVESCALLSESLRSVLTVFLIGSGPLEEDVRVKVKELNLEKNIIFLDNYSREEGLKVVSNAWLLVLLSQSEGFPISVVEALQLGVPVLASDVGGVREIITNTVGALVPKNSTPSIIAPIIEHILTDKTYIETLSINARQHGQLFTSKEMSRKLFTLYESLT